MRTTRSSFTNRPSGQTQSIPGFSVLELIRAAARGALQAPTPQEAADIAFGALVQLDGALRGDASAARQLAVCAGHFCIGARYADGWLIGVNASNEAVILLPGDIEQVDWVEAMEWAHSVGGELPTRADAALLRANFPHGFAGGRFWTSETCLTKRSYPAAWYQSFNTGNQAYRTQRTLLKARSIRRIPLDEFFASLSTKEPGPFIERAPVIQSGPLGRLDRVREEMAHA